MSTIRVVLALAILGTLVVGGGWLGFNLAMAGPGGCATALLQGTLVESDGTLAVQGPGGGPPAAVHWPFGYAVERRDGRLVLTRLFQVVAREGDVVGVGGGMLDDDATFDGCGPVTLGWVIPPEPTVEPKATFIVMATVSAPCIPPPSGCGYQVTLTSPSGERYEATFTDARSYDDASNGVKATLRQGPGLPTTLAPGRYPLEFELTATSDMVSFDANGNQLGPQTWLACSATATIPDQAADHVVTVRVAFDDASCMVESSPFVEATAP